MLWVADTCALSGVRKTPATLMDRTYFASSNSTSAVNSPLRCPECAPSAAAVAAGNTSLADKITGVTVGVGVSAGAGLGVGEGVETGGNCGCGAGVGVWSGSLVASIFVVSLGPTGASVVVVAAAAVADSSGVCVGVDVEVAPGTGVGCGSSPWQDADAAMATLTNINAISIRINAPKRGRVYHGLVAGASPETIGRALRRCSGPSPLKPSVMAGQENLG